jgi:hypothetical protein
MLEFVQSCLYNNGNGTICYVLKKAIEISYRWETLTYDLELCLFKFVEHLGNYLANGSIFYVFLKGWSPLFLVHSCVVGFENFVML